MILLARFRLFAFPRSAHSWSAHKLWRAAPLAAVLPGKCLFKSLKRQTIGSERRLFGCAEMSSAGATRGRCDNIVVCALSRDSASAPGREAAAASSEPSEVELLKARCATLESRAKTLPLWLAACVVFTVIAQRPWWQRWAWSALSRLHTAVTEQSQRLRWSRFAALCTCVKPGGGLLQLHLWIWA
jgi:hypothetical protein